MESRERADGGRRKVRGSSKLSVALGGRLVVGQFYGRHFWTTQTPRWLVLALKQTPFPPFSTYTTTSIGVIGTYRHGRLRVSSPDPTIMPTLALLSRYRI